MPETYILASSTTWPILALLKRSSTLRQCIIVIQPDDLEESVKRKPRYIFFPHWSWFVPETIINEFECVGFHMTDLPYGRGGTPLQNLILRGTKETIVTAFRMTEKLDAGPIYGKQKLSLDGSAYECYQRAAEISLDLLEWIIATEPKPTPQVGEITTFERRKPEQSILPENGTAKQLYDHIRMLDAPGYPHAFLEYGKWRLEFTEAEFSEGTLDAQVRISLRRAS